MRSVSILIVGLLAAASLVWGQVTAAWAHASLVKSSPANGAVLKQTPSVIQATFDDDLDKASALRLYDSHQTLLARGGLDPQVAGHRGLKLVPPHLGAGTYTVQWVAISSDDGATRKGAFKFSIAGTATAPAGASANLPPLRLVAPPGHAQVKNPVAVVIETSADISQVTMGSGMSSMSGMGSGHGMAAPVHLHIIVDGTAYMPAVAQMTKVGPSRYQYNLPKLAAGAHTMKVFWADNKTHAPSGAVQTVTYTVVG